MFALKSVPVAEIWEIVTEEFPVLVSVRVCEALLPEIRLPKFRDAGFARSCRTDAIPAPLTEMVSGDVGAVLTSVRLPEKLLAEAGSKATLNEVELPGVIEIGNANPEDRKLEPVSET